MTLPPAGPKPLPGIDPRFHQARKYLSPIKHKGVTILASHGSCKEEGCNYRSAWTTNEARDRGMWSHRATYVREERMKLFSRITKRDQLRAAELLMQTADCHTHQFSNWKGLVQDYIRTISGVGADDVDMELDELKLRVAYDMAVGAKDMAKRILQSSYSK